MAKLLVKLLPFRLALTVVLSVTLSVALTVALSVALTLIGRDGEDLHCSITSSTCCIHALQESEHSPRKHELFASCKRVPHSPHIRSLSSVGFSTSYCIAVQTESGLQRVVS
jgi:hypothetical protein